MSTQQSENPASPRIETVLAALGIAAIAILVFHPILDGRFLNWDDDRNFLSNESFRGLGASQLAWAWRTFHLGVWQPLAWVLFGTQYELGGLDPRIYHAFSVGMHALCAATLFLMAKTILDEAGRQAPAPVRTSAHGQRTSRANLIAAAIAATLFALHPLRVEVVAWVSCQPYLPSAFFCMLAVILYIRRHRDSNRPRRRILSYFGVITCYLIALAFKAPAITLPIVLLILDVYPLRRVRADSNQRSARAKHRFLALVWEKLPFIMVAVVVAFLAMKAKDVNESRMPFGEWKASERLAQSAYGVVFYLWKTIWPTGLSAFYELPSSMNLMQRPYFAAAIASLALTAVCLVVVRRRAAPLAAWTAYLVILAPNLGMIQISQQIAADRYAYLATVPLFLLLAGAIRAAWNRPFRPVRAVVIASVCVTCIALSFVARGEMRSWRNSESLWTAALAVNPRCAHAHCALGQALASDAQTAPAGDRDKLLADAAAHLAESARLKPDFAFAYSNLGAVCLYAGRYDDARAAYVRALDFANQFASDELSRIHAGLAIAFSHLGDKEAAWQHIRLAQRLGLPPEQVERLLDLM
ncbi:MAG: tetratricopeptide repeat protein [Phycisphaerae bacterium]|nr:tetratricopeptide repeat protein [Phycisphaerae bacterium]